MHNKKGHVNNNLANNKNNMSFNLASTFLVLFNKGVTKVV